MYKLLINIQKGSQRPLISLEHEGLNISNLKNLRPLSDVMYFGEAKLQIGRNIEQVLADNFGYLLGFDDDGCLLIYRDRLGTFPLFMFEDAKNHRLILFNRFYLIKEYWSDLVVDKIGFWETLLYESALGSRCLFENVIQIPSASSIRITPDLKWSIKRYWTINYEINKNISKKQFLQQCYERFDHVFASLNPQKHYLLPISGGVDSRLMAAFMTKHLPKEHIHPVTYGFDSRILEYRYAKQVCSVLGLPAPIFHQLIPDAYIRNHESLAKITGGCISIQNSHLFDCCNHKSKSGSPEAICAYGYSDGVIGFDAEQTDEKKGKLDSCDYLLRVAHSIREFDMPLQISDAVRDDLSLIYQEWKDLSSISSFNEYVYLTERNTKFHLLISDMLREIFYVKMPYTDPLVCDFYFSVSNKFRHFKLGTIAMMEKYFPALQKIKVIGSLFGKERFKYPLRYPHFRLLNFLNYVSAALVKDKIIFLNPYQTETHGYNLRKYHRGLLERAVDYLQDNNIIDGGAAEKSLNIPTRGASGYVFRYQLMNGAYVLALFKGQKLF